MPAPLAVRLSGLMAPVVTPFDAEGELLLTPFALNGRAHLDAGMSGLVVAGSTGEAPFLSDDERGHLVERARCVVEGDNVLIVGAGAESTAHTIARARAAAERGADAVLVVPPHYFGSAMTDVALDTHYRRVADASPCPVLLYNIPKFTHLALDPALVASLAGHGNIAGMKDSSGDTARLGRYLESQSASFAVITGHGQTLAQAVTAGVRGAILAVGLFATELALDVMRLTRAGDPAADELQRRLTPLAREIAGAMGPAGIKAALDQVGLFGGPVRAPLLPLDDSARGRVAELLREAGVALAT